jgi:hypothetical protein
MELVCLWPDGTTCPVHEYNETEFGFLGDDYTIINGADIEYQELNGTWRHVINPAWNFDTEYRILQPTKKESNMISMDKTYRYASSCGTELVRILCTDRPHPTYKVVAVSTTGIVSCHTKLGIAADSDEFNLIEATEYDTWLIDAPVHYKEYASDIATSVGHFAGVGSKGLPLVWADGKTSHTAEGREVLPCEIIELVEKD